MTYTERTFEYVGGTSSKFWNVRVVMLGGAGYQAGTYETRSRWGKIGSAGKETVLSSHNTEWGAARAADDAAAAKLSKGYTETTPRPLLMGQMQRVPQKPRSALKSAALTDEQREKLKGLLEELDEVASS